MKSITSEEAINVAIRVLQTAIDNGAEDEEISLALDQLIKMNCSSKSNANNKMKKR